MADQKAEFYVVGPGGDPGESGIYRRGDHPRKDKMVVGSFGLRLRGYDIHNVATWGKDAVAALARRIEKEPKVDGCIKLTVGDL